MKYAKRDGKTWDSGELARKIVKGVEQRVLDAAMVEQLLDMVLQGAAKGSLKMPEGELLPEVEDSARARSDAAISDVVGRPPAAYRSPSDPHQKMLNRIQGT